MPVQTLSQSKPGIAVQAMLYGPAPFFCYPWKPLLNDIYGGGYDKSYTHFRMQHMDGANLFYHCLCLVWQLSSNYALLRELDKLFKPLAKALSLPDSEEGAHLVTRSTSLVWCWHLLRTSPTPKIVKFASVASIYMAHNHLGVWFDRYRSNIVFLQGFIEAMGVQRLLLNKPNTIGTASVGYFLMRTALWKYLSEREGAIKEQSGKVNAALVVAVAAVASSKQPLRVVFTGLIGWIIALLTGNKALYYWSCGMMATISQGVAHRLANEAGTLEVLQNSKMDQTSYEFSHVTFFPNILFQSCLAHFKGQ